MAGNAQSGKKLVETMIKKHGSREAWSAHMRSIASEGGKAINPNKGFGSKVQCGCSNIKAPHHKAQCAGKRGGSVSKRSKS